MEIKYYVYIVQSLCRRLGLSHIFAVFWIDTRSLEAFTRVHLCHCISDKYNRNIDGKLVHLLNKLV